MVSGHTLGAPWYQQRVHVGLGAAWALAFLMLPEGSCPGCEPGFGALVGGQ